MEKYSDHAWILRYRKERDDALKVHRRQYNRRLFLSKLGLARAPQGDEMERRVEIDHAKEHEQEVRKGWVKAPPARSRPAPVQVSKTKSILGRSDKKKGGRRDR